MLQAELRRRGMSEAEIEAALRKKKRSRVIAFNAVKTGQMKSSPAYIKASGGGDLTTVEDAAQRLQLHPKTVLRMIHEGRLKATRIGKSYRIRRRDVDALAGVPPSDLAHPPVASVTSIVDMTDVTSDQARTWALSVTNALNGRPHDGPAMRTDVIYDPDSGRLKIVIVGGARDTANLLALIQLWSERSGSAAV